MHDLLLDFAADGKTGVLLCTHLLNDVEQLCNRIGIVHQGRTQIEGRLGDLLARLGNGQYYRLRLEGPEDRSDLPAGLSLVAKQDGWWHVRLQPGISGGPSALWAELWRRGWRILEIRSAASRLEQFYLTITAQNWPPNPEAAP